jgi:hypothetical protein
MTTRPAPLTRDINRVVLAGTIAESPYPYDLEAGPSVCFLRLR